MLACEVPVTRAVLRATHAAVAANEGGEEQETALARAKRHVPDVVARVGRARWYVLVSGASCSKAPVISRAYHKLHEIARSCVLPRVSTSLHLCEAPGGFVQCTGAHLAARERWEWMAVSLGGGAIAFDASLHPTTALVHADVLADPDAVARVARSRFAEGVELVTADGAVAMDHAHLEEEHAPLLWAECRIALACLRPGGTFVVKFFEGLRPCTQRVVAVVTRRFRETSVIKPTASRPTNSERYLVCRGFLADAPAEDAARVVVAAEWHADFTRTMDTFTTAQVAALHRVFASVS